MKKECTISLLLFLLLTFCTFDSYASEIKSTTNCDPNPSTDCLKTTSSKPLQAKLPTNNKNNIAEICDNGYDDDGDGYVDCYDTECICNDSDCSVDVKPNVLEAVLDWESNTNHASINASPFVANLNPNVDSLPEVIVCAATASITTVHPFQILIFAGDGSNKTAPDILDVGTFDGYPMNHPAIADVNGDGIPELAIVGLNSEIRVFTDYTPGANPPMTQMMISTGLTDVRGQNLHYADFDQDGTPEIYAGNDVFQFDFTNPFNPTLAKVLDGVGADGRLIWANAGQPNSNSIAADFLSAADCGDPDCDGLEIAAGYQIYSVDLDFTDGDGLEIKVQRDLKVISGITDWYDGYTTAADLNQDGVMDVVVNSRFQANYGLYLWDKNGLIRFFQHPTSTNPTGTGGMPTIANVFDDRTTGATTDLPEIVVCSALKLNAYNLNAAIQNPAAPFWWSLTTTDASGVTGATAFDFNGDDIQEIVYRDQNNLRIMYGGPAPFPPGVDAQRNWYTFASGSGTFTEYPVVADVDNDREAEIIYTTYPFQGTNGADYRGRLRVIQSNSSTGSWMSARQVWNQYGYFVTHVNDDLTIPAQQQNHILEFPTGSGNLVFNKVLVQTPLLDKDFEPYLPVGDGTISLDTVICNGNTYEITTTVCNIGNNILRSGTPITFYGSDPTTTNAPIIGSDVTASNLAIDSCTQLVSVIPKPITGFVYSVINDDGSLPTPFNLSTDFPSSSIEECDYSNNMDGGPYEFIIPLLDLGPDVDICQNDTFQFFNAGTGFVNYTWQDGSSDSTFAANGPGIYWVNVTDYCGTMHADTVIVIEPIEIGISFATDSVSCYGISDGMVTANTTGGIAPYTYQWDTGDTTITVTGLSAGAYVLSVTDSNGCLKTQTVNVKEPTLFGCDITATDVTCFGNNNGTASVSLIGGTPGYSFLWDTTASNQTTQTAIGLTAGTYDLTVTDSQGCPSLCSVTINEPEKLKVFVSTVNVSCIGLSDGSITLNASGGTPGYSYQWDMNAGGGTMEIVSDLPAGVYEVTVTDTEGCIAVVSILVNTAACDLCAVVDICATIATNSTHPVSSLDCDGDGAMNSAECTDNTDPLDECDFEETSVTQPVTADQSGCLNLNPDLSPIMTILPGNIAGSSAVGVAVEIVELNTVDTDGSIVLVRIPSDPRFAFVWDIGLTNAALVVVNNSNWNYLGDNGFVHQFQYNGPNGGVIPAGLRASFGFNAIYDPQGTDGQTTITCSIVPYSGGETNLLNNTDSERLVYFK